MKKLLLILLCLCGFSSAQQWSGILDPSRAVDWSAIPIGVTGGIPSALWTQSGATIAAGASAATIQTALNACGTNHFVQLGSGIFTLNNGLSVPSNCELRGMGANLTGLNFTGSGGYSWGQYFIGFIGSYSISGSCPSGTGGTCNLVGFGGAPTAQVISWTGTNGSAGVYTKGATTLNLGSTPPSLSTGMTIMIVQQDDNPPANGGVAGAFTGSNGIFSREGSAYTRNTGLRQNVKVTGVSGSQITISPGILSDTWRTSQSPVIYYQLCCMLENAGVRNLTINGTTFHTQVSEPLSFFEAANVWAQGVVVKPFNSCVNCGTGDRSGATIRLSRNVTVVDNFFDTGFGGGNSSTTTYCTEVVSSTFSLIQNNIYKDCESPILFSTGDSYGVAGYNFVRACSGGICTNGETGIDHHEVGYNGNLWEGNQASKLRSDDFHGSELFTTYFRNYSTGNGEAALDMDSFARYANIIGNVLAPVSPSIYAAIAPSTCGTCDRFSAKPYRIGYPGPGTNSPDGAGNTPYDTFASTVWMRWGNYDTFNNATHFLCSEVPTAIGNYQNACPASNTLPPSFYLAAKPAWWPSAKPWPAIGPDVTGGNIAGVAGHANTIPASDCYDSIGGNSANFNADTCYPTSSGTPVAQVLPTSSTFAALLVNQISSPLVITISNIGSADLTISSLGISGDFTIQSNTCGSFPATVLAGNGCTASVTFSPTQVGTRTGTFSVTDNASGSPHTVSLSGQGQAPTSPPQTLIATAH